MESKVLILCDEPVTKEEMEIENLETFILDFNELTYDWETSRTEDSTLFFVNWETLIPEDISYIQQLRKNKGRNLTLEEDEKILREGLRKRSYLEKAYQEMFYKSSNEVPIDYGFVRGFLNTINRNSIMSIVEAHSEQTNPDTINTRTKMLQPIKEFNQKVSKLPIKFSYMEYQTYGDIYKVGEKKILEMSQLYWREKNFKQGLDR